MIKIDGIMDSPEMVKEPFSPNLIKEIIFLHNT